MSDHKMYVIRSGVEKQVPGVGTVIEQIEFELLGSASQAWQALVHKVSAMGGSIRNSTIKAKATGEVVNPGAPVPYVTPPHVHRPYVVTPPPPVVPQPVCFTVEHFDTLDVPHTPVVQEM